MNNITHLLILFNNGPVKVSNLKISWPILIDIICYRYKCLRNCLFCSFLRFFNSLRKISFSLIFKLQSIRNERIESATDIFEFDISGFSV